MPMVIEVGSAWWARPERVGERHAELLRPEIVQRDVDAGARGGRRGVSLAQLAAQSGQLVDAAPDEPSQPPLVQADYPLERRHRVTCNQVMAVFDVPRSARRWYPMARPVFPQT